MPRYFKREGRGKGYEDVTREVAALRAELHTAVVLGNGWKHAAQEEGAELERVTTERDKALMAEAREGRIRLDAEAERDDAYALIRHYADTDPEVALAERMRPVVEAAKACADCDCESPRHDDDGNLFLPKGGYPCAWDCPHLEGLLDAVDAFRVATSEYVCDYGTACIGPDCEMEHTHRVATSEQHPYPCHAKYGGDCTCTCPKASEQEASGTTTFHCYVCDAPDGECDREKHRARDEQEADDA